MADGRSGDVRRRDQGASPGRASGSSAHLPPGFGHVPAEDQIVGVVTVGGYKYAVSLVWNVPVKQDSVAEEARESAERLGGNGFCIYTTKGDEVIYGLSEERLGHKSGQKVLASSFADVSGEFYAGAFTTDDGRFWLVGIMDKGRIVFDRAYGDESLARREFLEIIRSVAWKRVVCPESWGIEDSGQAGDLASLVKGSRTALYLRSLGLIDVSVLSRWVKIALVAVLAVVALRVLYKWRHATTSLPLHQPAVKQQEVVVRPWADRVPGDILLKTCVTQILQYGGAFVIPGWNGPNSITCSERGVSLSVTRGDGTMSWVLPSIPKIKGITPQTFITPTTTSISWDLPKMSKYKNVGQGDSIRSVQNYLFKNFDDLRQPIGLSPAGDGLEYILKTDKDIRSFYPLLIGRFNTHVVNQVTLTIPGMHWTVDGMVFRDKPEYAELPDLSGGSVSANSSRG